MRFGLPCAPEAEDGDGGGEAREEEVLEESLDEFCAGLEGEAE